jgi:hypothetical protein
VSLNKWMINTISDWPWKRILAKDPTKIFPIFHHHLLLFLFQISFILLPPSISSINSQTNQSSSFPYSNFIQHSISSSFPSFPSSLTTSKFFFFTTNLPLLYQEIEE